MVDAAYEKRSIALSSNLHPAGFDELMPKTLATATVDRLLHHAHVFQTNGDSIRLTCALDGKGVHPAALNRQWSAPADRWADQLAITGHFPWPPTGSFPGRRWAELVTLETGMCLAPAEPCE
ncbi:MAG TPA: ATP-binding protein [Propionibacteriaceae bacterium]|nr:ATP-binding protein [Propionibacteriaceae bacterium]